MTYKIFRHLEVEQDIFDIVDLIAQYAGTDIAERKLPIIRSAAIVKNMSRALPVYFGP